MPKKKPPTKPPIQFSTNDLKNPSDLERVLRQFQRAIPDPTEPYQLPPLDELAALLAPFMRQQLQATGIAPLNLENLLPVGGTGLVLTDTHANRLTLYNPNNYAVGQLFYETNRTVFYVVTLSSGAKVWTYADGVMYAAFSGRPTDLSTNDAGFLYEVSDHLHLCRWTGSAWVILDNDAGTFIDSAVALGTGWQLCDGTATTYLAISGADLAQTAFTTPDENSGAAGVYHESIAVYSGTINAATAPGISGNTANATATNQAATATNQATVVDPHAVIERLDDAGAGVFVFDTAADAAHASHNHTQDAHNHTQDAHAHGVGTLAVDSTGEPRRMGVLRYFRR